MRPGKVKAVVLWVVSGLLAALFVTAAVFTFVSPFIADKFRGWGYADWFRIAVAVVELVGAALLLFPRTARVGAAVLAVVMMGAVYTHAEHDPPETVLLPIGILVVLLVVIFLRRRPRGSVNRG